MGFNISRHLAPELIKLDLVFEPPEEPENGSRQKWVFDLKKLLLSDLVDVLDPGEKIGNRNKLLLDFINREKKASTGIGCGFAIPHVRSMQAKEFIIAFARIRDGIEFDAIDKEPVKYFFVMAAPPYEDGLYLKVFKAISELIMFDGFREQMADAVEPFDVIKAIRSLE